jgi:hypothetical protein
MPSRETIFRIAKMLAGATGNESAEASVKLQGAYKRMARDGVTLRDLLSLPLTELYQDTLNKLVDVILDEQNLSPSSRRVAYAAYMDLIASRFAGRWDGQSEGGQSSDQHQAGQGSGQSSQNTSREDAAREYEERRKAEEAARARANSGSQRQSQGGSAYGKSTSGDEKPFKSNNGNTAKQERSMSFTLGRYTFTFSVDGFLTATKILFGRGSILWHTLHDPVHGLRLLAASLLYGFACAGSILVFAAVIHTLTGTSPWIDIKLKNAFAFLTALGFVWKARLLYLDGWFR